jgi:hypothetical protein
MMGIEERTSPPDQACLDIRFLGGWVRAQKNQLVILMGMSQAKHREDYSTHVGEAQAKNKEISEWRVDIRCSVFGIRYSVIGNW